MKLNSGRRLVDDDVGLGVEFWPRLKSGRRRVVVVVVGRRVVGRRVEEATKTPAGPAARANEASPVAELLDALEMAATECEPPTPGDATDAKLAACCALALANNPAIKESTAKQKKIQKSLSIRWQVGTSGKMAPEWKWKLRNVVTTRM